MTTTTPTPAAPRRRQSQNAGRNNQPDPRPLTEYAATYSEVAGRSRVTVTLAQPCVIRLPKWTLINAEDGSTIAPVLTTVVSNTTFSLDFAGLVPKSACFIAAPWQDMEVQNFQGGFARPGGQWFARP